MEVPKLTLLSKDQIWEDTALEVLKKYGKEAAISDLCILTGSHLASTDYNIEDTSLDSSKRRTSWFWTRSDDNYNDVCMVYVAGGRDYFYRYRRFGAVRPVIESSAIYSQISLNKVRGYNDTYEVEYGEYPQWAAPEEMQQELEEKLTQGTLNKTRKSYTFDSAKYDDYDTGFRGVTYDEYEYQGRKFIRVKANFFGRRFKLSNGIGYKNSDYVWVEVSPVKWLLDEKTKTLVSKIGLVS